MMTLIELYVNEPYDNLLAATVLTPDTVVYVCSGRYPDIESQNALRRYLSRLNPCVGVDFVVAASNSPEALFNAFETVFEEHIDCAIDFTGGDVAAAMAAERYCSAHHAKAFYIDYDKHCFVNVYGMEDEITRLTMPRMNIPLLFAMGGACITGSGHATSELNDKRVMDAVRGVIRVYLAHKSDWSASTAYFQSAITQYASDTNELMLCAPAVIENQYGGCTSANVAILEKLSQAGALTELEINNNAVRLKFMNQFMRRCLSVTGMWLELLIYISALDSKLFDDVRMSVEFDWDGVVHGDSRDTRNEIDVILIKGLTPVFISCKSGAPKAEDLYEIFYLTKRFGGSRAKAVMATAEAISLDARTVFRRALDMNVAVIESEDLLDDDAARLLFSLAD